MEGKDFRQLVGKLVKVVTNIDEEIVGNIYGYNADLKLLVIGKIGFE